MSGHTPGPWRIDRDNADGVEVVGDNGDLVHIESHAFADQMMISTTRANAYLIAAAPDLLAALQLIEREASNSDIRTIAGDAIAKATGAAP